MFLCNSGMFAASGHGTPVPKALYGTVQNKLDWSADDNDRPLTQAASISKPSHSNRESNEKNDFSSTNSVFK